MAKEDKYWNEPVDINVDWGGDIEKTDGKPLSGAAVQSTIKNALNSKVGYVGYCATNKMNVLTKDEASFLEYDRLIQEDNKEEAAKYRIGEFKAMASHVITITVTDPETYSLSVLEGMKGVSISFSVFTKTDSGEQLLEGYTYKITNPSKPSEFIGGSMLLNNTNATVNIDKLLNVGNNSIVVTVNGNESDVSIFKTINVKVIKLQVTDRFDISNVYNFKDTTTNTLIVPYSVVTNAPTTIHWFIDYNELEDKRIVYSSNAEGQLEVILNHGDLTNGVHTLMYYAEYSDGTTAEPFRTNISYRNFFVRDANYEQDTQPWFSFSFEVPYSADFIKYKQEPTFYSIQQYDNIPLVFAIDTYKGKEEVDIMVQAPGENDYVSYRRLEVDTKTVNKQNITIEKEGVAKIKLVSGNSASKEFELIVEKNTTIQPPRTANLLLSLTARGKSNKGENFDKWVSSIDGKTYEAKLEGFQWNKNSGWGDNKLIIRNGSSVEIPFYPFGNENNYINGFTFEMEFTTTNVYNENGEICNITNYDGTSGIVITASEAIFYVGGGAKVSTKYKSGKTYRIAFVKTITGPAGAYENQRFVKIYVNGVLCGIEEFSFGTIFANNSPIKITGTKDASIELTDINFYNSELSDDEILNNYMFYRTDGNEKTALYSDNNIYDENGNIDRVKLNQQLPVMIFYQIEDSKGKQQGELHKDLELEFSDKGKTIWMDIEYIDLSDPDGKYDFYWKNAGVRPQGTSSMKYPKKNYRIYTQRDSENADLGVTKIYVGEEYKKFKKDPLTATSPTKKKRKYQFKDKAAPVKCWCLKADFAESSGTHNTGVAKYWNQVLTNSGYKTNAQIIAEKHHYKYDVRTTVDGFPIALFYKPIGKDMQFLGKYNFNNDKSTEDVFGFTGGDEINDVSTKYVPIGFSKPIIQTEKDENGNKVPVAEIFNQDTVFYVKDENGTIVNSYVGKQVFENPNIDDEVEAPLYYEETQNGKTLYYKLQTNEMFDNARMECWELLNSGTDLALFRRKMTGDSSKDMSDDNEKVGYIDETGTFQESFESRFPDCGETYHTYNLQRLIEWLYDCMYLKSEIVEETDENGIPTGNIKGRYVPMTQEELKTALGNDYKSKITIGLRSKPADKDTFKYISTNEDGTPRYYQEIAWEKIKDEVTSTDESEENGVIFEKPIEEYRPLDITDEQAETLDFVEKQNIPVDENGNHRKEDTFITVIDNEGNRFYYRWGYTKVYYVYDYTTLKTEIFGYNYVYDVMRDDEKYYTWGDFLYFDDFLMVNGVPKEYDNTPENRALKFAVEKYDHFRLDMMAAYYIYLMRFGGVDQTVKNAMLTTEGSDDNTNLDLPSKWYFINYDNDTVLGVKNDGRLVFDPYITRDSIENNQVDEDGNAAYCYAGRNSTMWNNLEMDLDFMELVPTIDDNLQKQANTLSYADAIDMFNNQQSGQWCERVYNWDAKVKYINTFTNREGEDIKDDEGNNLASFDYLLNVQGPRSAHREWWLSKRFNIFDSKYTTGSFKRDVVTFKCNGPSKQDDICPITSGEDIFYGYYKNNPSSYFKTSSTIKPGNTWNLTVTANSTIGDPHAIFGSPNIEKIDFRNIAYRITELQMSGIKSNQIGTKLKELLIGDNKNPKLNRNFSVLGAISNMEKLEVLDLTGCQAMNLNDSETGKLMNLRELYLAGTSTQNVSFINGGDIEIMELPSELNSLSLVDTTNLTWDNLKFIEMSNDANSPVKREMKVLKLANLSIKGCPKLLNYHDKFLSWLENRYELIGYLDGTKIELDNIEWHLSNEEVNRLMILSKMQKSSISIKGKIYVDAKLTLEQVRTFSSIFESCFEEGAALEIIAQPGVYVTKFGNREDFILEGDEMPNEYEVLAIGFKQPIVDITTRIYETDEKDKTTLAKDGIYSDINLQNNVITISIDEIKRTVVKIDISATVRVENEDGTITSYISDENLAVTVKKRTYPTKGVIKCLEKNGKYLERKAITNLEPFTFEVIMTDDNGESNFNGNIEPIEWQLSGEAFDNGNVVFVEDTEPRRCIIKAKELNNTFFTLSARIYRIVEGEEVVILPIVVNEDMILKNENILLTAPENPALFKLLDDYGFIGEKGYLELSYAQTIELTTPCPKNSSMTFGDIFKNYKGYKTNPTDYVESVQFTDFSIFEKFESIATIGNSMFKGCSNLKTIVLPPNTQSIETSAFEGCTNLQFFDMPKITNIGSRAFASCTSLVNVTLPDNVRQIGSHAFYGCTKLQNISLSKNVTEISNNLFDNCTSLRNVSYGDITKIGDLAFKECYSLEKLNIPEALSEIIFSETNNPFAKAYKLVFEGGNDIFEVKEGTLYFNDSVNNKKWIIKHNPNNNIVNEENYAAAYSLCGMAIEDLTIPSNIIFNGDNILNGSKGNLIRLTKRFVEHVRYNEILSETTYNEYKFHENETLIPIKCFMNSYSSTLIIPNGIEEIGEQAFYGCNNVISMIVPASVSKMYYEPFHSMSKLNTIEFIGDVPPKRMPNTVGTESILSKLGDVNIIVNPNCQEQYQTAWPDYKEIIISNSLPSEGFVRVVVDGKIYDSNNVKVGGVAAEKQNNGYYKFITTETSDNKNISIDGVVKGTYTGNYMTLYDTIGENNGNLTLYSTDGKGIDFTRGIVKWRDLNDYFKALDVNWEYDSKVNALKSPKVGNSESTIIQLLKPEVFAEDGYITMTMGQTSEDGYDYFVIYETDDVITNITGLTPMELDILEIRNNASINNKGIGKALDGLKYIRSNYIKFRFKYTEGKKYYFSYGKDSGGNYFSDSCWIYTIGNPVFIEPMLDDAYIEEYTIKVNPIVGNGAETYPEQGVKVRIWNDTYFDQYFLLNNEGQVTVRLPKDEIYHIDADNYMIGDKPYYFIKNSQEINTNGSLGDKVISLNYEYLWNVYVVDVEGKRYTGTNTQGKNVAYYIYADETNDYYISPNMSSSVWSNVNGSEGVNEMYVSPLDAVMHGKLYDDDYCNGYDNTRKIRKYFSGKDIITVATQANSKTDYKNIIDWYVPSVAEIEKIMESELSMVLSKNFTNETVLWTSNLVDADNAWAYKHSAKECTSHAKKDTHNIMFFGKIKI